MGATRAAQRHPNSIVKFRGKKGWTVQQLADRVQLDEWTVRQLELGKMDLHAGHVHKFSEVFEVFEEDIKKPCRSRRNSTHAQKQIKKNLDKGRGSARFAGKLTVPENSPKLVRELFEMMNEQGLMIADATRDSGVSHQCVSKWRYSTTPTLMAFQAVLNNMGYDLQIVPQQDSES